MKNQVGVSLTELLIALFISTFMVMYLMQMYLYCKEQYLSAQQRLLHNFDKQWIQQLLIDSVRRAGFTPCMGLDFLKVIDRRDNKHSLSSFKMREQGWTVHRMHENYNRVLKVDNPKTVFISADFPMSSKYPLIIADCVHAEIHQALKIKHAQSGQWVTLQKSVLSDFQSPIWIGEWIEEHWFIDNNAKGLPALYYQRNKAVELTQATTFLKVIRQESLMKIWTDTKDPFFARMRQV